ncbi:tyrosine-protein phosphatase non-receptor type 22 isoform X3 [Cynoglossus semilaevis]|uniref:tyrosine-protein phosphatase non-receptor type 22 isoform X3 n=1 Tax=Cynoglossus semilaevis TaxID=244447 RepID=UPI000D62C6F2|nr:uncharacterized protein LOC103385290 isoform X3 [Cynoglossus semilaevis]
MEQQASVLKDLLTQLESQENADQEAPNGFAAEFLRLKSLSIKYRTDKTFPTKTFPTKTGEKQENVKKNRYKDIVPFDHSRVKLSFTTAKNEDDYINANFLKGVTDSRAYIATQGPLPHTLLDFFRMLWEYNIQVVVMACREFEMGRKKSERYWPLMQDQPFVCEPFTVYCDSEENKGDYVTRMLRVTYQNSSRIFKQLHYMNWPDHGVPDAIPPILEMLQEMRTYQDHDDIPICIHCSAGCGRTGALCAIDYTWNLLKKEMITPDFNIYELVQNMRTQRPSLVQTKEQYELVGRTIKVLFNRYLTTVDSGVRRAETTVGTDIHVPNEDSSQVLVLQPESQQKLDIKRDILPEHHPPLHSENITEVESRDKEMRQNCPSIQILFDDDAYTPELQKKPMTPPKPEHLSHVTLTVAKRGHVNGSIVSMTPPPLPKALCLMVEDPYFESPLSSPPSDEVETLVTSTVDNQEWKDGAVSNTTFISAVTGPPEGLTDEDAAPPLPERTPESYILAVDPGKNECPTEEQNTCKHLSVIIPRNAAADVVRELRGCPPSPTPTLPERTPESYKLPTDDELKNSDVTKNRIGRSSEWSGDSNPTASENETKPWNRSKSLKAKMKFRAPTVHIDLPTIPNLHRRPPADLPSHTEKCPTRPPSGRTHDMPTLKADSREEINASCREPRFDENPQNTFVNIVRSRSKSARDLSSSQETLTAFRRAASSCAVRGGTGSAVEQPDVNHRPSVNTDVPGSKGDRSSEKVFIRKKSLFHKQRQTYNVTSPPADQSGATPHVFKFRFGNRFGKPKGPRDYPQTWV